MRAILTLLILISYLSVTAQAKKPTLMVVPSDNWCVQNGYTMTFENQGITETIPDYTRAFQENVDLLLVVSKINGLMAERDFPLKNMESVIKNINSTNALDAMRSSKSGGAAVAESLVDQLLDQVKADIIIQLTWTVNTNGPKKSVTFNLQGLDAYSNKQVATAAGTGATSFSVELLVLLEETVQSLKNYREVTLANAQNQPQTVTYNVRGWW